MAKNPQNIFCNLEKRHFVSKTMSRIVKDDGSVVSEDKTIVDEVKVFYEKLYEKRTVEDCEISDLVNNMPQLSVNESENLEGEITFDEACHVLK